MTACVSPQLDYFPRWDGGAGETVKRNRAWSQIISMTFGRFFRMKSAHYAVFLGVCLIAGATAAQDAPASNAAQAESREGLPDTYTGPVSAVAAIVDDKVITTFDVDQRTLMMIIGSGRDAPGHDPPAQRARAQRSRR